MKVSGSVIINSRKAQCFENRKQFVCPSFVGWAVESVIHVRTFHVFFGDTSSIRVCEASCQPLRTLELFQVKETGRAVTKDLVSFPAKDKPIILREDKQGESKSKMKVTLLS